MLGLRDDQHDRLADEADAVVREPGRNGTRTELPPTPLKNDSTGGVFHPVATRSAPVTISSTPGSFARRRRVDPHDLGMRPVGAQKVRRGLPIECVIGGVAAPAGDEPQVLPAPSELMV